jgi:DNA-binding transcriptional regulator YiaG
MTPTEFASIMRDELRMSVPEMAVRLGRSAKSVGRYISGSATIPPVVAIAMICIARHRPEKRRARKS